MADEVLTLTEPSEILPLENPSGDVVVLARNPEEMVSAQRGLIDWATRKLNFEKQELAEAEQNLATAKSLKHRTAGWSQRVKVTQHRVTYYEKILAALKAGYCIVPNFPIQVIATRTAKAGSEKKKYRWMPEDIKHEQLPQGQGDYVNPQPDFYRGTDITKLENGQVRREDFIQLTGRHAPVDFPFKLVKPQVLSDLKKTMLLKIFDDIGVLPQVRTRIRRPDPMLIGRIIRQEKGDAVSISFLITWWIDSRDL